MRKVLAKCLKTYPDEDGMVEYTEGNKEPCDVKIYHKGKKYYVLEEYCNNDYYEIIEPRVYKA